MEKCPGRGGAAGFPQIHGRFQRARDFEEHGNCAGRCPALRRGSPIVFPADAAGGFGPVQQLLRERDLVRIGDYSALEPEMR